MRGDINNFWIAADWPAPSWIKAGTTLRQPGLSLPPYAGLNLAEHVGDELEPVEQNRSLLQQELQLPSSPLWLQQVHGIKTISSDDWFSNITADACYTGQMNVVCAILTADCLPLFLCNKEGSQVAVVHIGWRGFCANILDEAVASFDVDNSNILAWIGPHIHSENYEVGDEVRKACLEASPGTDHAFTYPHQGLWQASLDTLVRHQLIKLGISMVYGCDLCTFEEQTKFFSYRREPITGRMASLIWMESSKT
jgi:YfiH family protein